MAEMIYGNPDFLVVRGTSFIVSIGYAYDADSDDAPVELIDMEGWTARSQIRHYPSGRLMLDITDYITIQFGDDIEDNIVINVPPSATKLLKLSKAKMDIILTDTEGNKIQLFEAVLDIHEGPTDER